MAIIFVTNGAWGTGTGVPHPPGVADNNFYELRQRVTALETTPPVAVSYDHSTVVGDQWTIHLTNATTDGPFTIPTATLTPKGEWTPLTNYSKSDTTSNGGKLYQVRQNHTSAATFDPDRVIGGQPVYVKILEPPVQVNDYHVFLPGPMSDNQLVLFSEAIRVWQLPATLSGSLFRAQTPALADTTLTLRKNGSSIGTLLFGAGNATPTVTFASLVTFSIGDDFSITGPVTADTNLADISLDIFGTRI